MKNFNASTDRVQFNNFNNYIMDRLAQLFDKAFPNAIFDNLADTNIDSDGTIHISGRIRTDENTVYEFNIHEYINPVGDFINIRKLVNERLVRNDKDDLSTMESKEINPDAIKTIVDKLKEF